MEIEYRDYPVPIRYMWRLLFQQASCHVGRSLMCKLRVPVIIAHKIDPKTTTILNAEDILECLMSNIVYNTSGRATLSCLESRCAYRRSCLYFKAGYNHSLDGIKKIGGSDAKP